MVKILLGFLTLGGCFIILLIIMAIFYLMVLLAENIYLISEFDRLIKENGEQIAEYKRLLKAAIEDLNATATEVYNGGVICECCKWESQIGKCSCPDDGGCDTDYQWRYADEALKLIGED